MSYNSSTGIITAPVSIDDVHTALGASGYDLGTLCKSDNINMYSIRKPTRWSDLFKETSGLTNAQWVAGEDGDYGISHTETTLAKLVAGGSTIYGYFQDPKGVMWQAKHVDGTNYPYRLADFEYYVQKKDWSSVSACTNSPAEFSWTETEVLITDGYFGGTFKLAPSVGSADSGGLLNFLNCVGATSWSNMYLGFIFCVQGLSSGGDSYNCKYFACTLPVGSIGVENTVKDSHSVLQGTSYRVDPYQYSILINLPNSVLGDYTGKTIAIRPVVSNAQIYWPYNGSYSADSSTVIKIIMPPEHLMAFSATLSEKTITDLNYKSPTLTVTAATVVLDSGNTYKVSNVTVKATRDSTDAYSLTVNLRVVSVTLYMEVYAGGAYNYYTSSYSPATGTYESPVGGTSVGSFTIAATASSASKAMSGFSATATASTGVSGTLYGNVQVTVEIHVTDSSTGKVYKEQLTAMKRVTITS